MGQSIVVSEKSKRLGRSIIGGSVLGLVLATQPVVVDHGVMAQGAAFVGSILWAVTAWFVWSHLRKH